MCVGEELAARLRWLSVPLALVGGYVALEWLSFIHEHKGLPITPWNPGLGLVFALMLVRGPRYGGVLFFGVLVAEFLVLQTRLHPVLVLGVALIISCVYSGAAALARRQPRLDLGVRDLRDILIVLACGFGGAGLATLLLPGFLLLDSVFEWSDIRVSVMPLLLGDLIGIAVMTPLILRVVGSGRPIAPKILSQPEVLLHAALVLGGLAIIAAIGVDLGDRFFYLLFVPVILAGVRFGIDGACLSLAFTQFGLVGILRATRSDAAAFTEFQTLMFVLSATGLIVGAVVTERQNANARARAAEARLRDMEAQAAQADRFHLVSGMASALAHEINQPMTAVRALVRSVQHILGAESPDLDRARSNLGDVVKQIDHAGGILRRTREFLRRGQPHRSTLGVRDMVEDALMLVEAEARAKHIRIETDIAPGLPPVHGDRVQLQQVVLNLVRNAIDSISDAGRRTGRVTVSARYLDAQPRIEIAVADDGPGLEQEVADRVFEPLTTSKRGGLGLGLPICVSIVESHSGRVWLHSREAGATEFRFLLPLDRQQAQ
jgi:signal transduction histidine kinase